MKEFMASYIGDEKTAGGSVVMFYRENKKEQTKEYGFQTLGKKGPVIRVGAGILFLCLGAYLAGMLLAMLTQGSTATADAIESSGKMEMEEDWGLGFGREGEKPTGNASSQELARYQAWYVAPGQEKVIYLTFDAGYENGNTEAILEALRQHGVSATFFLVGNYLETQPEMVQRMVAEGHTIGNHTYHHPDMGKIKDPKSFAQELTMLEDKYREITGEDMVKLYRPPQGKYSEDNLQMAKDLGYHTFFWSLAYVDWYENDQPTKEEAMKKLVGRIHPGAIVLLHSTSATNGQILEELLTTWEEMGYRFGTLQELITNSNGS